MTIGIKEMATTVAALGLKSFLLGIIAENKKPASGTPWISGGVVTCKYPSDPTVFLGFLSIISLAASAVIGFYAVFYPYKGKSVPHSAFFRNKTFFVFFNITMWLSLLAQGMLMWATITELIQLTRRNVYRDLNTNCPTAKTGLFGGAAFMALNASLFWLICLMLADNTRDDYFDEEDDENLKGEYGQVLTIDYDAKGQSNA